MGYCWATTSKGVQCRNASREEFADLCGVHWNHLSGKLQARFPDLVERQGTKKKGGFWEAMGKLAIVATIVGTAWDVLPPAKTTAPVKDPAAVSQRRQQKTETVAHWKNLYSDVPGKQDCTSGPGNRDFVRIYPEGFWNFQTKARGDKEALAKFLAEGTQAKKRDMNEFYRSMINSMNSSLSEPDQFRILRDAWNNASRLTVIEDVEVIKVFEDLEPSSDPETTSDKDKEK